MCWASQKVLQNLSAKQIDAATLNSEVKAGTVRVIPLTATCVA